MTALIPQLSSRPILKALGINKALKAITYRLEEMNESMNQLKSVAKLPLSYNLKRNCFTYIKRQQKLTEIAQDLRARLSQLRMMDKGQISNLYQSKALQQVIQEVDLFNEMYFQVKKSYITFLHRYYKPQEKTKKQAHSMVA